MKEMNCADCGITMIQLLNIKKPLQRESSLLCSPCATTRQEKRKAGLTLNMEEPRK